MTNGRIPDIPVEFPDNSDQRTLCVLILDGSGSMAGQKNRRSECGSRQLAEQPAKRHCRTRPRASAYPASWR